MTADQQEFNTPMMQQYREIKDKYRDCLLFFRMGDFYELFLEDAHIGSKVLNITLTSRAKGKDGRIPMAGVPYHAVDTYLAKLVKAGYKVAICEQVSLPNKYGIVDREVVRVVTPGTVLDENALVKKENNFIVALSITANEIAFSIADISTGYFSCYEIESSDIPQTILSELEKISPTECIVSEELYEDPQILKILSQLKGLNVYPYAEWNEYADDAQKILHRHFNVTTLSGFGVHDDSPAVPVSAVLLGYLQQTQKSSIHHFKKLIPLSTSSYVQIDRSSIINLELFSTIREHDVKGSLLYVLDQTVTPMGGRLLKGWLKQPLVDKDYIELRYNAVDEVLENRSFRHGVYQLLSKIPDIERTLSRLSLGIGNARDLVNLKLALISVLAIKETLENAESPLLKKIHADITQQLSSIVSLIERNIINEPPFDFKAGGIIKKGVNKELDDLRSVVLESKDWMSQLEENERKKTQINSLKVRFNKVFGFYIEVSKANLHLVPEYYDRKQTLVNGERFITPELKHHEEIILSAEEKIIALELDIYQKLLDKIVGYTTQIQLAAAAIGYLDCLICFANISEKNQYTRPVLSELGEIRIINGRHPVVEQLLENKKFVPNTVELSDVTSPMMIITGPNMAGKSVLIRQVALISLMAQIGCFVPAEQANLSIVDKIFVRSGASDVITSGLSTFMVEMVEAAYILHNATPRSLIVMDEIGRGTSTYDGISIAWAIAEYLVTHSSQSPNVLFATHYHELQKLEEKYPKDIKNYHMAVADEQGVPVFLHTLLPGGASHSFGVAVAKLAGVPREVVENANRILNQLEKRDSKENVSHVLSEKQMQVQYVVSDAQIIDRLIHKELEKIDISRITPLEALNKLAELKERLHSEQDDREFSVLD